MCARRDMVGPHLHVSGAFGSLAVQEWSDEVAANDALWFQRKDERMTKSTSAVVQPPLEYQPGILQVSDDDR